MCLLRFHLIIIQFLKSIELSRRLIVHNEVICGWHSGLAGSQTLIRQVINLAACTFVSCWKLPNFGLILKRSARCSKALEPKCAKSTMAEYYGKLLTEP